MQPDVLKTWRFDDLTFCKPDVPDVLKPDALKPYVLKPDVLWVYPRRCDESRMQSPSEEKTQAALLLWAAPLPYCTGCLYRPTMPGNGSISRSNQKSSFRLKFHRFLSNHKNPNSANKCPITEPKKRTCSLLLSNISCHTHDLQIRGHPQDMARHWKLSQWGMVWGGGKVRKGRERVARDQLTPLIRSEGGGQKAKQCLVSNCTQDMYSTPVELSFFCLRSAVEASIDTKMVQMEPNNH